LQIPTDVLSQILNEHRERPELMARVWDYVQARMAAKQADH
jgi:hypothetical protein